MSPQEAQARNEREIGVTVTAFSSAKKKGPVKGATRLENIFIGRDGARVKEIGRASCRERVCLYV